MKLIHLCNKYASNGIDFKFDPIRKYDILIESDEEANIKGSKNIPRDFKPNGFWLSPVNVGDRSHSFYDFAINYMSNVYYDTKFYFEISDDCFINWTEEISKDESKILVITPEDVPKLNSLYKVKGCVSSINFSWVRENYGGIMFKPYDSKLRLKYIWYNTIDGESVSVWNLKLVKQIDNV